MAANHSFHVFTTFVFFFFVLVLLISPSCALQDGSHVEAGHEAPERWTEARGVEEALNKAHADTVTNLLSPPPLPPSPSTTATTATTITITTISVFTSTITPPPSLLHVQHRRQIPDPNNADAIADLQSQITSLSSQLSALSQASAQSSQQLSQSLQQASQSLAQASQRLSQTEQSLASARITQQAAEQASRVATQAVADLSRQMTEMSRSMSQSAEQRVSRVSQSAEERIGRVMQSMAAVAKEDGGGKGMNMPVLVGTAVGGVVGSSVLTGCLVVTFMRKRRKRSRGSRGEERGRNGGEKEGGEVMYVGSARDHVSARDVTSGPSSRGSSSNSRSISTRENIKSYHSPVVWVASTDNRSTAGSGQTRVASRSTLSTSAIKLSDYEDESVYNDDGANGGPPPSSRGGSLMEGRTALSPPPPPIPPRARSRSRSAPKEAAPAPPAGAAATFPFTAENPVLPAPAPRAAAAASVLLSPFPPRPKSVRKGVGTGPVKRKDRQNSGDEAIGVGYTLSYYSPVPPPPVRAAPSAPKWAPPTIPGYEDDAKPLNSSDFKLDDPPHTPPSEAAAAAAANNERKSGSNNRNTRRFSIFPGPSPSPTPSTQGWSSSPLSSPSTPPVPSVPADRLNASEKGSQHKRGGSGGTEGESESEKRGRSSQKRQQQTQTRGSSVTGQSRSPAPTLEAWLRRGMSSTRVPVRTGTETGTGGPRASLPRSASTSNLAVRRQSYTARLREQVQQQYLLDVDDGGRGEDWPIRQS